MDFYRGDCSKPDTCRPDPAQTTYKGKPVLDGGGSLSLQIYAAAFGLQDFPVFFDTTFQNQLFICVEGQGDCFQPDSKAVEGVDYVRYTSDAIASRSSRSRSSPASARRTRRRSASRWSRRRAT